MMLILSLFDLFNQVFPVHSYGCSHEVVIKRSEELLKQKAAGANLDDSNLIKKLFFLFNGMQLSYFKGYMRNNSIFNSKYPGCITREILSQTHKQVLFIAMTGFIKGVVSSHFFILTLSPSVSKPYVCV